MPTKKKKKVVEDPAKRQKYIVNTIIREYGKDPLSFRIEDAKKMVSATYKTIMNAFDVANTKELINSLFNYSNSNDSTKEKYKFKNLKTLTKTVQKELLIYQDLFEELNLRQKPINININSTDIPKVSKYHQEKEHVLFLSDWHAGETVSYEQTLGLGKYDIQTLVIRLQKIVELVAEAVEYKKHKKLHIILMGDMINGNIHDELLFNAMSMVADWCGLTNELILYLISELKVFFDEITVTGVPGNHGRLMKKPYSKNKYNNFDYIIYKMVEDSINIMKSYDPNIGIDCHFGKGLHSLVKIQDKNYLICHGDGVKTWGTIPHYGLTRMHSQLISLYAKKGIIIDYVIHGHFHISSTTQQYYSERFSIGSLKGIDEYAMDKGLGCKAQQLLAISFPNKGIWHRIPLTVDIEETKNDKLRWNIDLSKYINSNYDMAFLDKSKLN